MNPKLKPLITLLLLLAIYITIIPLTHAATNCTDNYDCTEAGEQCNTEIGECELIPDCQTNQICEDLYEPGYECVNGFCEANPECSSGETQTCDTGELGICSQGTQTCNGLVWGECIQDNSATTEICSNSKDDDCDGNADSADSDCQTTQTNPTVELDVDDSNIDEGDEVTFVIIIVPNSDQIQEIKINFDDGNTQQISVSGDYSYLVNHEYDSEGSYTAIVEVNFAQAGTKQDTVHINVDAADQENNEDDSKPTIQINYPEANKQITTQSIKFRFTPDDDNSLKNCTLKIYKDPKQNKTLEYEKTFSSPEKAKELSQSLSDFEDTEYSVEITCQDSKSQKTTITRFFSVLTKNYEQEAEINFLLDKTDNFLDNFNSLNPEEQEILEELGTKDDVKYYKKRLVQINQDLGTNIKMLPEDEKIGREKELLDELEEIKNSIPIEIKTLGSDEYIKNTPIESLEDLLGEYVKAKNLDLNERKTKILAKKNEEIQTKLSTKTKTSQIQIKYNDSEETITYIKKEIQISDPTYTKVLEKIPNEIKNPEFLSDAEKLTDNLYEIDLNGQDKKTISYYVKEKIPSSDIKETQTILFKKFSTDGFTLTGYSILGLDAQENIGYFLVVFGLLIGGIIIYIVKIKPTSSNNPNVKKIKEHIKQGITATKKEEIQAAKQNYYKIREHYTNLSRKEKQNIYGKLAQLKDEINKREMVELIREYKRARRKGLLKESEELYNKIKDKHTHLPEKYQKQVKEKILMDF